MASGPAGPAAAGGGRRRDGDPQHVTWKRWGDEKMVGYPLVNYGKSPFSMGKSTISMAIFNSYVKLPEGNMGQPWLTDWWFQTCFIFQNI
jgi:hypothetical protein